MKKYNTAKDASFECLYGKYRKDYNNYTIIEKNGGFYVVPKCDVISPLKANPSGAVMDGDDIVYEIFVFRGKAIRQYPNGHLGMGDEWDNSFVR